jgi:hypothetical protein
MTGHKSAHRRYARKRFWEEHDRETYRCPHCERPERLTDGFEVHHKNGNAFDNRLENLVALCRFCHCISEERSPGASAAKKARAELWHRASNAHLDVFFFFYESNKINVGADGPPEPVKLLWEVYHTRGGPLNTMCKKPEFGSACTRLAERHPSLQIRYQEPGGKAFETGEIAGLRIFPS